MVTYNFRCNIYTLKWLRRLILIIVLLLFCSITKIIPIDIHTQIINDNIAKYVHLSQLEIHKDSKVERDIPTNQVVTTFSVVSNSSREKQSAKEKLNSTKLASPSLVDGNDYKVNNAVKLSSTSSLPKELDVSTFKQDSVNKGNESTHLDTSTSKKPDIIAKLDFHRNKKTCRRMRMELGGENQKSILTSFGKGRLGNKLASFASTYAICQDYGLYNYISENQYRQLSRVFDFPRVKEDREDSPYYVWRKYCGFNAALSGIQWRYTPYNDWRLGMDQMKTGNYIKVSKWINDIKGFFPHIKTLRNKILRFRKQDVWNAKKIMSNLNPQNYTMVSIHVRLTDYKPHLQKLYHFKQYIETNYFRNAMEYFTTKYKNVLFYVISDDIKAAKDKITTAGQGKYNVVFPGAKKHGIKAHAAPTDLVLLSLADHSILTYGTYGMWGALLAKGGETIMSKDFLRTDIGTQIAAANLTNWKSLESS